ncbi:EsaB/YukD family protein [Actinomyces howellii]|uniref:Type VII secretion integral membrane protein EccD n=1 Tax=Actinomyces howellii TaxID=52771 RepID=A0A3S4TAK6_9ACTO|nr:EsaB/YukD family protein [Actinomyces howellii]VEG29068.1 type VII secretion integral membrane protein EccD [Actinomyces howellii]
MIPYTRVTLLAESSRAELAMPSTEPVGAQMPSLLELLGATAPARTASGTPEDEPAGQQAPPTHLVRADGRLIDPELDLASQQVLDGEVLRLVALENIPAPTRVSDLSAPLSEMTRTHPGRWRPTDRLRGTSAVLGLCVAGTAWPLLRELSTTGHVWASLLAVLLLSVPVAWRIGAPRPAGWEVPAAGVLVGLLGAEALALALGGPDHGLPAAVALVLVTTAGAGLGARRPGWALGAGVGLAVEGMWLLVAALSPSALLAHGILAVAALVLTGSLPWVALTVSGAARLDDTVLTGTLPPRSRVRRSLATSHDVLVVSCIVSAVAVAATTAALAVGSDPWGWALALAVVLATALRSRAFPLRVEVISLWLACLPAPLLLLAGLEPPARLAVLALVVVLLSGACLYRPAPHTRVRLQRTGDLVEAAATASTIPLLCGLNGLFSHLLGLFS